MPRGARGAPRVEAAAPAGTRAGELHVLMELSSSDLRIGAVNDAIDLAGLARPKAVRFTFCGPLDERFKRAAAERSARTISGQSRSLSRPGLPLYGLSVARWVARLARLRPDVVHLNYGGWGPSLACAARSIGIPVVARAGGGYYASNPANRWISAYCANCAAQAEPQLGSPLADRVVIAGDLFRPDRVRAEGDGADRGDSGRRPRILFLGQVVERKGIHVLVEALARVTADCELWIVGGNWAEGEYAGRIKSAVAALGLGNRVRLENHRDNVVELFRTADVFVLPSLSDARPRSIIEAMFMKLPVVGTRVGGIPSLIEDGVTGTLVPPGDAAALAAALERLVADPDLARQLGRAGYERAEADCRPDRTADRYIDVYRRVIANTRGARSAPVPLGRLHG